MNTRHALLALAAPLLFGACSSSVKDALDGSLQNRIDTMQDCFPVLYDRADRLFEIAQLWRTNVSQVIPDPVGLTWSEQPDGSVDVMYNTADGTYEMTIRFYSPDGMQQDLDLSAATTLNEAIGLAADQLRDLFGEQDKFMVGAWDVSGSADGGGALTGIIGGTTNQNELEELRTTTDMPAGGPPPIADATITLPTGCVLTFRTDSLQTDTVVDQQYPIGVVTLTVAGSKATVNASITFNNTVLANIVVNDVPGSFSFNLDTGDLDYNR